MFENCIIYSSNCFSCELHSRNKNHSRVTIGEWIGDYQLFSPWIEISLSLHTDRLPICFHIFYPFFLLPQWVTDFFVGTPLFCRLLRLVNYSFFLHFLHQFHSVLFFLERGTCWDLYMKQNSHLTDSAGLSISVKEILQNATCFLRSINSIKDNVSWYTIVKTSYS